jgi:hypothetical protein
MGPTGVRLFSLVFILVGGVILCLGVKSLFIANASKSWPTVQGKVISSSVDSKRSDKGGTTYHAEVFYEYKVGGQIQSSNDVAVGGYGSSNPSHARRIVNKYPAGSTITVYYSPSNPSKAVLEAGISRQAFFLPGFGAVFFGAGLAMFIFMPGVIQRQQAARDVSRPRVTIK